MNRVTLIRLKEHVPGPTVSISVGPDGATTDCPICELLIAGLDLSQDTPVTLYGVVAGEGVGAGNFPRLRLPYFFVSYAVTDNRPTVHPEVIERIMPSWEGLIVVPWIAQERFSGDDLDGVTTFTNMERDRINKASDILSDFLGDETPGSGVDVYMWVDSVEESNG